MQMSRSAYDPARPQPTWEAFLVDKPAGKDTCCLLARLRFMRHDLWSVSFKMGCRKNCAMNTQAHGSMRRERRGGAHQSSSCYHRRQRHDQQAPPAGSAKRHWSSLTARVRSSGRQPAAAPAGWRTTTWGPFVPQLPGREGYVGPSARAVGHPRHHTSIPERSAQ